MADEHKKHPLSFIVTIATALISAYVAVTIAKTNAKTEIAKSELNSKQVLDRLQKLEEHAEQDTKDKAKMLGYLDSQNQLLQMVFASQAGNKTVTLPIPPLKTYAETPGRDRPPTRTITRKQVSLPPPKQAAKKAVAELKVLHDVLNVPP